MKLSNSFDLSSTVCFVFSFVFTFFGKWLTENGSNIWPNVHFSAAQGDSSHFGSLHDLYSFFGNRSCVAGSKVILYNQKQAVEHFHPFMN